LSGDAAFARRTAVGVGFRDFWIPLDVEAVDFDEEVDEEAGLR